MVNWGKRPEFNSIPSWRKRLDVVLLCIGIPLAAYQMVYIGLGLYYKQIDPEQERLDLRALDDKVNQALFGKPLNEMSPVAQRMQKSLSLIEMAAQIRENQERLKEEGKSSNDEKKT